MGLFPKIARPCPYVDRLDAVMDGDFCTMCKREVHDLTDMDEAARRAFLAACGGSVCVRYTVWMKPAMAAAALAASAGGMSALGAGLGQPPRPAVDGAIGAAPYVGEPVPLAGAIAPPPQHRTKKTGHPPKLRHPTPVVEIPAIPMVTAGLPMPIEVKPEPAPTPAPGPTPSPDAPAS